MPTNFSSFLALLQLLFLTASTFAQSPQLTPPNSNDGDDGLRESCPSNVCFFGGTCFMKRNGDGVKEFECQCRDGYAGDLCEHKCSLRCQNGGHCRRSPDRGEWCQCPPQFGGPLCADRQPEDCRQQGGECPFNQVCLEDPMGAGVARCEWDLCSRWGNPCSNNATCRPVKNDFICECPPGFQGRQCAEDIDECQEQRPCRNGATCENTYGSHRCKCTPGFTGKNCQFEIRPCPAPFVQSQNSISGSNTMECTCPPGKAGEHCELAEANCDGSDQREHCQNGGQCIRMGPKAFCICPTGFSGPHCEQSEEHAVSVEEQACLVRGRPCLNGGKCVRKREGTLCKCKGQFTGVWCDRPLRLTAGKTTATSASAELMESTTTERTAQAVTASCYPNPCQNGGVCFPREDGSPHCHCPFGRATGSRCQLECHCPRGQGCRQSAIDGGEQVECFRRPEDGHPTPTNGTNHGNEEHEESEEDEQAQKVENIEELPEIEPGFFDIFAHGNGTEEWEEEDGGDVFRFFMGRKITNCSECVNALKCLKMDEAGDQVKCLCSPDYTGPLCDMKRPLCTSLNCSTMGPAHRCVLQRENFDGKRPKCGCPPGLHGPKCARSTVLGFSNTSTLLLQQQQSGSKKAFSSDFRLAFTFRTTLAQVHLASGETLLGKLEFRLGLNNGQLVLSTTTNQSQSSEHRFDSMELRLNDGDWWEVVLWSGKRAGTGFQLRHSESGYLLARRTLSASKLFSIWNVRLGQRNPTDHFLGCMRDVVLNGGPPVEADDERAFGILPGCNRQEQCQSLTSQSQCANGGKCIDLWDQFACECPRPFLPPKCEQQLQEVTFGHGNSPSNINFALSADDRALIGEKTKISFLLRTNQQKDAPLFLLGESAEGAPNKGIGSPPTDAQETSTFLSGQLQGGTPKVNVRLGGRMVFGLRSSVPVNDNRMHLVEIEREGNALLLRVDHKAEPILRLSRPFPHPLLANQLQIGEKSENSGDAFSNGSAPFFKGVLQDFRVNDHFVLLDNEAGDKMHGLPVFGQKHQEQNVLQGTISDDICAMGATEGNEPLCGPHGQCRNTFNDFQCQCEPGWMGPRCEQRDFCGLSSKQLCPNGTKCENVEGAFVCTAAVTLSISSTLRYALNPGNVIKDSARHTNFSMEFRTRTPSGNLLIMKYPTATLQLEIVERQLRINTNNGTDHIFKLATPIADGQWHKLVLRQQQQDGGLQVVLDGNETVQIGPGFSLKNFALDPKARITIGRFADDYGIKGCLQNIRLGTLPPLLFMPSEQASQEMAQVLATIPHFALQHHENIPAPGIGCHSPNLCGTRPQQNPCLNGGQCEDRFNEIHCECPAGFGGEFCELRRDECAIMDGQKLCGAHGKCVNELNGFRCQCAPGFSGPKCSHAEDLCRPESCKNGGKCRTVEGIVQCDCPAKFTGQWCQMDAATKCAEVPCQNGGQCFQSAHGEFRCSCRPGFNGPLCELPVDPCREMPCLNGGKCVPTKNSTSHVDFHCECPRELGGALCEKLVDNCVRLGNQSCSGGHGTCENVWGGHLCICLDGWRGRECDQRVDICREEMPCQNGGLCLADQQQPGKFHCQCPQFYHGDECEHAGICAENPCQNDGECIQRSATERECRCPPDFKGPNCEQRVDPCEGEPCVNGASCVALPGGQFQCQCMDGFQGKHCEIDIDECQITLLDGPTCQHGGKCLDRVNGTECDCLGTGYKGIRCDQDIDECAEGNVSCENGDCLNLPGTYRCECKTGYIGQHCHMVNPCVPDPLTNNSAAHNCAHGLCVRPRVMMGAGGREFTTHDCDCFAGYTGELCMRLVEAGSMNGAPTTALSVSNLLGLAIVGLVLCLSLGAMLYLFLACTRHKRANQGTYSPSTQEMTGQARFVGVVSSTVSGTLQPTRQPQKQQQLPPAIYHPNEKAQHVPNGSQHKVRRKQ